MNRAVSSLLIATALGACTSDPPPVLEDYQACVGDFECAVVVNTCCGVCGASELDDVEAVNRDMRDAYFRDLACPDGAVDCPECAAMRNPNLQARCELPPDDGAGRCGVVDVRTDAEWGACETDDDCRVRTADCCECNGDVSYENLIAVNCAFPTNSSRLCDPPCGGCLTYPPDDASARCTGGFCELLLP